MLFCLKKNPDERSSRTPEHVCLKRFKSWACELRVSPLRQKHDPPAMKLLDSETPAGTHFLPLSRVIIFKCLEMSRRVDKCLCVFGWCWQVGTLRLLPNMEIFNQHKHCGDSEEGVSGFFLLVCEGGGSWLQDQYRVFPDCLSPVKGILNRKFYILGNTLCYKRFNTALSVWSIHSNLA